MQFCSILAVRNTETLSSPAQPSYRATCCSSPRRCSASPEAPSPSSASTWVPERLSASANCTLHPAFMHRFYNVYVPAVPFCSAVFCPNFHPNPEYASLSVWGIQVFTLGVIPLSFQYVFVDALTAMSLTKLSLFLSLLRKSEYFAATCLLPLFLLQGCAFTRNPLQTHFASSLPVLPSS